MLETDFHTLEIKIDGDGQNQAQKALDHYQPALVISIERPGLSNDGRYYNMRGIDISEHCADLSNWAAHGLAALLSAISGHDILADWNNTAVLQMLSDGGSVDGVTGENTLTEDGVDSEVSQELVTNLRKLSGF